MPKSVLLAVAVAVLLAVPAAVYAAHAFNDVSSSHTFHEDIAWMKDSGVTKGCNPPANDRFCPDDLVTRGQMSAFLHRLADLQVVDAGTLDGKAGTEYKNPTVNSVNGLDPLPPPATPVTLDEFAFTTPGPGGLIIDATVFSAATSPSQPSGVLFWIQIDDTACVPEESQLSSVMVGLVRLADDMVNSSSIAGAIPVSPGTHTVSLCAVTGVDVAFAVSSLVAEYATSVERTVFASSLGGLDSLADFFSK